MEGTCVCIYANQLCGTAKLNTNRKRAREAPMMKNIHTQNAHTKPNKHNVNVRQAENVLHSFYSLSTHSL